MVSNKSRLLRLYRYLYINTDKRHLTTKAEIMDALRKYPKYVRRNTLLRNAKYTCVAATLAMALSLGLTHYETFISYAAIDAQMRVPAVKERLGRAGIRIREILAERYGDDIDWLQKPEEEGK